MQQNIWQCPNCLREFSRKNQRHACGTGNSTDVLGGRPQASVVFTRLTAPFNRCY